MKKTYKKPSIVSEDLRLCFVTGNCNMSEEEAAIEYNSDVIGEDFTMARVFFPQWSGNNPCDMTGQEYNDQYGGGTILCYLNPDDNNVVFNS